MKERRFNYEESFVAVYGIYYGDDAFAAYGDCHTLKEKGDELHEKKKEQAVFSFSLHGGAFGCFAADSVCGADRYTGSETCWNERNKH